MNLQILEEILLDKDDEEKFGKLKWYINNNGYLVRSVHSSNNGIQTSKTVILHRLIMNCPKDMEVDHINRNKLDNRKQNLRIVTHRENMYNYSMPKHNTSKFLGVSKRWGKWAAVISLKGKSKYLGSFLTKEEASQVYQNAVNKYRIIG
jgi:hypothetical protein